MTGRLHAGGSLATGQDLASANRRALLTMQGDGNLVLYEYFASGRRAHLWDSATAGNPGATAHLRDDGDLVVRRTDGRVLWSSGTARTPGVELVLRDTGDLVLVGGDGRCAWSSGTRLAYARADFTADRHAFAFPDDFADPVVGVPGVGDVTVRGRSGGLVFAALDHWHAGLPLPRWAGPGHGPAAVPPDGHWLADYVHERLLDSYRVASAVRFAEWSVHADHATWLYDGVDRWCRDEELPRLVEQLRTGRPVPLGLVRSRSLGTVGENRQVLAHGFEHDRATGRTTVVVHDSDTPGVDVLLTAECDGTGWTASTGARWRGFFVQDYTPREPPVAGPVAPEGARGHHGGTRWADAGIA